MGVKKPFSVRVEDRVSVKFKALTCVLNIDGATLLEEIVDNRINNLDKAEIEAYESLVKVWKNDSK